MSIVILPDAQEDLLSLQDYMLEHWSEPDRVTAEDEIFEKLTQVDSGFFVGSPVPELASIGMLDYKHVFTSHHRLIYRRIDSTTFVYTIAAHRQDFPVLLMKRLLRS